MADRSGRLGARRNWNRLQYACDGGLLSGARYEDARGLDEEDSNEPLSSDSESSESVARSRRLTGLSAALRVFSESMMKMELAEMEMIKAMEASRCEAEKRRLESEAELARMLSRTQLQIASAVAKGSKKRRRGEEDESRDRSKRGGPLLLSLLQFNSTF